MITACSCILPLEMKKVFFFFSAYLIFRHARVDHVGLSNGSPTVQSANSNFTERIERSRDRFDVQPTCGLLKDRWLVAQIITLNTGKDCASSLCLPRCMSVKACGWNGNGLSQGQSSHIFAPCAANSFHVRCWKLLPSRQHGDGGCWVLLACPESCRSICRAPWFICFILFREYDTDRFEFWSMLLLVCLWKQLALGVSRWHFPKIHYEL